MSHRQKVAKATRYSPDCKRGCATNPVAAATYCVECATYNQRVCVAVGHKRPSESAVTWRKAKVN